MYTCKIDQPYIPALLGKTKGKVFTFVFKCLKVSRICFKELIHSFIHSNYAGDSQNKCFCDQAPC